MRAVPPIWRGPLPLDVADRAAQIWVICAPPTRMADMLDRRSIVPMSGALVGVMPVTRS
jgi:hypothetical protein